MACYDFDYAIKILRQSIDYAEIGHNFIPLRNWANEVEQSGCEMKAFETRLNYPAGRDFLLTTLQSVAAGSLSSEEALQHIRLWLNSGQMQNVDAELTWQFQLA